MACRPQPSMKFLECIAMPNPLSQWIFSLILFDWLIGCCFPGSSQIQHISCKKVICAPNAQSFQPKSRHKVRRFQALKKWQRQPFRVLPPRNQNQKLLAQKMTNWPGPEWKSSKRIIYCHVWALLVFGISTSRFLASCLNEIWEKGHSHGYARLCKAMHSNC